MYANKDEKIIVTSFCDMLLEYLPGLLIFLWNEDRGERAELRFPSIFKHTQSVTDPLLYDQMARGLLILL